MSEERREMDDILKEVNDFFQKYGVLEAVDAFISSEEVTNRVEEAATQLIANMQKMDNNAPNDEIRSLAKEARTDFESDHACFIEDILSTFKVNFSSAVHLVVDLTTDDELRKLFIDSVKTAIPKKGMMDINDICATLVEMYSNKFMETIYSNYAPDGMPNAVADFLRAFCGGTLFPATAFFPEFNEDEEAGEYRAE